MLDMQTDFVSYFCNLIDQYKQYITIDNWYGAIFDICHLNALEFKVTLIADHFERGVGMSLLTKVTVTGPLFLSIALSASPVIAGDNTGKAGGAKSTNSLTLDFNEKTHLEFMCEEEKLARDVYITLGAKYPGAKVFGKIDDSEEQHKCAVADMLEKYGVPNPSTNDNVGVFTGKDYGGYFTEKFNALVARGSTSELEAYYVGAFIEELDMIDINQCPKIIVETDNGINDVSECGKVYTTKADINRLYEHLLDGSKDHLRAYVSNIEKTTGEGTYTAQILTQEQVDAILGR